MRCSGMCCSVMGGGGALHEASVAAVATLVPQIWGCFQPRCVFAKCVCAVIFGLRCCYLRPRRINCVLCTKLYDLGMQDWCVVSLPTRWSFNSLVWCSRPSWFVLVWCLFVIRGCVLWPSVVCDWWTVNSACVLFMSFSWFVGVSIDKSGGILIRWYVSSRVLSFRHLHFCQVSLPNTSLMVEIFCFLGQYPM